MPNPKEPPLTTYELPKAVIRALVWTELVWTNAEEYAGTGP